MKTFTITQISPKVMAREVNPLKKPVMPDQDDYSTYDSGYKLYGAAMYTYNINLIDWRESEVKLKEYELTDKCIKLFEDRVTLEWFKGELTGKDIRESFIGQTITGEVVTESGIEKIKVI